MKYISILRGINVSGHKKIRMDDLRAIYEAIGFHNVVSYIQSGNIIFDAPDASKTELKEKIEKHIDEKYKFHVPVEIRTKNEVENIIDNCPFKSIDLAENETKVLVTFLSEKPSEAKVADILRNVVDPEELVVMGNEVYLYCPNGYGRSKLSNTFIETKLGVIATTRNWKSLRKLHELSGG